MSIKNIFTLVTAGLVQSKLEKTLKNVRQNIKTDNKYLIESTASRRHNYRGNQPLSIMARSSESQIRPAT